MKLSRRLFLRSGTGAAVALPLLDDWAGRGARAQSAPPKRFIMLFEPNGTIPEAWFPTGGRTDFALPAILAPLAAHRSDLIVFRNVDSFAGIRSKYGDAHGLGIGCLWTGIEPQPGEMFRAGMGGPGSGWPNGPSVDQVIAQAIGKATRFPSLEYSVKTMAGSIFSRMSYRKAADPVTPESDPGKAFDRLFGLLTSDPTTLQRLRRRRKSVLDDVSSQLRDLAPRVSPQDRHKIDAHISAVRELEARLPSLDAGGTSIIKGNCRLPQRSSLGSGSEVGANSAGMEVVNAANDSDVPDRNKVLRDLMVMAVACDLTRVLSLMFAPSRSDIVFQWLGQRTSHHNYSHEGLTTSTAPLIEINKWYATQVATLIASLKALPEGGKTAFDGTVIVWANELGLGQSHTRGQLPILVAGSAGAALKTGQFINFPRARAQNDLWVTLCQAMGLNDVTTFGNPAYVTGPVTEMLA